MLTRIFKSGSSLAVRILKKLNFILSAQNVEIERKFVECRNRLNPINIELLNIREEIEAS